MTKDVTIPEDIVEEIGRFYGYKNIDFILPSKQIKPNNLEETRRLRKIKQNLAFSAQMHEVQNYPFYDEDFLKELNWYPETFTEVANPVSENWRKLVNSLIPHLLKNIQQNLLKQHELRFFELNSVWNNIQENKSLAGIFFDKKNPIDFYTYKEKVNNLFYNLGFEINWEKSQKNKIWYSTHQTAQLKYADKIIGYAGIMSQTFLSKISEGNAFIFEIDGSFLLKEQKPKTKFKSISKYPTVWLDISLLAPLKITVDQINNIIKNSDNKINKVELIDMFENPKWNDKKSLTFRYYVNDENKTLEKIEIDEVMSKVVNNLKQLGLEIR